MSEPKTPQEQFDAEVLPGLLTVLRKQMEVLESTVEVLQEGQSLVPLPTATEVAEMRAGKRQLTREAYLLGVYQRLILGAENLISDMSTVTDKPTLQKVHTLELSGLDFKDIERAIQDATARNRTERA